MDLTKYQEVYIQNLIRIIESDTELDCFNNYENLPDAYCEAIFLCNSNKFAKYHKEPRQIFGIKYDEGEDIGPDIKSLLTRINIGFAQIKQLLFSDDSFKLGLNKLVLWKASVDEMLDIYPYLLGSYSQFSALYHNAYGCYLAEIEQNIEKAKASFLTGALYEVLELSLLVSKNNNLLVTQWIDKCLGNIFNYNLISHITKKVDNFKLKIKLSFIFAYICKYFVAFYDHEVFKNDIYIGWLQHISDFLNYILYDDCELISFLISWDDKFDYYFESEQITCEKTQVIKELLETLVSKVGCFDNIDELGKAFYASL